MLKNLNQAQQQRLAFIDFTLQYYGQIKGSDVANRFNTANQLATQDLTQYQELAPNNLEINSNLGAGSNNYQRKDGFKPLFDHAPEAVLTGLCRGFGDGFSYNLEPNELCVDAIRLIHPQTELIASLMRAIKNRFVLNCEYISLSSGPSTREIVPHAIINNGHRWHTRAYDRQNGQFRDFVCSRFKSLDVVIEPAKKMERREQDKQWNKIVNLKLAPHPKLAYPQAIAMDYQMQNGKLNLELRAALAGYLLQQWQVDCSKDYQLDHHKYQLALENPRVLGEVENLILAPGFNA